MEHLRNAGLPQYPSHGKAGSRLDCCVISATGVEERSLVLADVFDEFLHCDGVVSFVLGYRNGGRSMPMGWVFLSIVTKRLLSQ